MKVQHSVSTDCGHTCKAEKSKIERDYKLLQENYERLIELNKDLQSEAKDRNYSVEIQLEELKSEYEKVKSENLKLKEQNDVQTKLWKVWLETHEKKTDVTENTSPQQDEGVRKDTEKASHQEKNIEETLKNMRKESEDEILLVEDDELSADEVRNTFLRNKKNGFAKTTPASKPENKLG